MRQRFIVRLQDDAGALLAWAEVWAVARPPETRASCPFFAEPGVSRFVMEQAGTVTQLSVHWADLNVARRRDLEATPVQAGQVFDFTWIEPVWLVPGMAGVALPAVTVGAPVVAQPLTGTLFGKDSRA